MNDYKWWHDPSKIAAIFSIVVVVFGFWFVRERQLWLLIEEARNYDKRFEETIVQTKENERAISAVRDRIKVTEERLEINVQRLLRMEGIIDRAYPQGQRLSETYGP